MRPETCSTRPTAPSATSVAQEHRASGRSGTRSSPGAGTRRPQPPRPASRPPPTSIPNGLSQSTACSADERAAHVDGVQERRRVHETRSTSSRSHKPATLASSRADTTSTTSQPSVSANTGATTRAPNPVPITPTRHGHSPTDACGIRVDATHTEVEAREEPVPERTDAEREQHGPDADVAAERPPDHERGELEQRTHDPQPDGPWRRCRS